MAITLNNVTKKYSSELVLNHVEFQFKPGRIYGLLGPNGSGKSTILKMITGLVYPNRGNVEVLGEKVTRKTCRHVAYLTELDMFYDTFTVEKMVAYHASQFPDFNVEKANQLLQEMMLDPNKKINLLSKGSRGRLKLVLTLARDTPIVLLDEPFSGLDPLVRASIVNSLLSYIEFDKQTVIIATHEIDEIEQLLDEVIILYNGEIIANENVEQLREEQGVSILHWLKRKMEQQEIGEWNK